MALLNGDAAFSSEKLSSKQLLDAQTHVWNHIFAFVNSMSLKCAIQLGIPDVIHKHGKPMAISELVDALPIDKSKSKCIYRLMRILLHSEFFVKVKISDEDEEDGRYWLTPASRLLLSDESINVNPFIRLILDPVMTEPFHYLSAWLSNDNHSSAFEAAHGLTIWERASKDARLNGLFNEAMASDASLVAHVLLKDCKQVFEGVTSLVDVAGGTGTVARAIANEFPHMKCIVLDLPHVVDGVEGTKNLTYVGGDMFQYIPTADVVFLKWIMHDWDDKDCIKILKKCKDAIPSKDKGGKVIVVDMVVDVFEGRHNNKAMEDQLFCDIAVMTYYMNGKERNENEWAKLFFDAGFTGYKVTPAAFGVRSLIELYP